MVTYETRYVQVRWSTGVSRGWRPRERLSGAAFGADRDFSGAG